MDIPHKIEDIGEFAADLISQCSVSMKRRMEAYQAYTAMYRTGSADGTAQIYKKTYAYIESISSLLYSPAELLFAVTPHGKAGPRDRALGKAAASGLNEEVRQSGVDTACEDAVTGSLIKGKMILQLLWSGGHFEPHLIQPEMFGVREENLDTLAEQKAFFHRSYITLDKFDEKIRNHPKRALLQEKVKQYTGDIKPDQMPDQYATTRMVMLGGLYPYQVAGNPIPGQSNTRGVVDWMSAPQPTLSPDTHARVVPFDELWVWDSASEDWATIQMVGPDCVVTPTIRLFNAFADNHPVGAKAQPVDKENPLRGKHPFVEFCVNRVPGYFWGDSEVRIVGAVQQAINARIDGINHMLRMQEKPPRIISGASINQNAYAKLNKPAGYLIDGSPTLKHETLTTPVPPDMWTSLHEYIEMYNDLGGLPPAARGEGAPGIRSQGHFEGAVRMASPRFKDRAIAVERSVDEVGGLGLDILKARVGDQQVAWLKPTQLGLFKPVALDPELYEPPSPGMVGIEFIYEQLLDIYRVGVDNHSSSPIFSHDAQQLLFNLAKLGAVSPRDLIAGTHPANESELIEDIDTRDAEKAALIKAHPELLEKEAHGGRRR